MKVFRIILSACCVLLIVACQNVPKSEGEVKAGGQFLEQNNREQYSSAALGDLLDNLSLNDAIDQERVRLIGPIGTGSVQLISADNRASLISGKQEYKGIDADYLVCHHLMLVANFG